jgi:hypothetical protein
MAGYIGSKAVLLSTTAATVTGNSTIGGNLTVDTDTLFVDAANNRVGIGTTSPLAKANIVSAGAALGGTAHLALGSSSTDFENTYLRIDNSGNSNFCIDQIVGGTSYNRLFIERTSGNVGIGTSSPSFALSVKQSAQTFNGGIALERSDNTNRFNLAIDSNTTLKIGYNDSTKAVIDSSGNVGIGTSSPQAKLVASNSGAAGLEFFTNYPGGGTGTYIQSYNRSGSAYVDTAYDALTHSFRTNSAERMRIDASGSLRLGTTLDFGITNKLTISYGGGGTQYGIVMRPGADTTVPMLFQNAAGSAAIGSISTTASATAYNTSSDYRLKEDVQPMVGASDRLMALKPVNFAWKASGERVDGFLAHEAQEVVPEAVTGSKDAMRTEEYEVTPAVYDDEGNLVSEAVMGTREVPEYQGIDQSKIVPLLTAALQEALTKIEQLEARMAILEGGAA